MRTWSQRGYVTFPRSHGNRTRSGSQLRPGRGSLHRPQRGVEGGVRYLPRVRSFSFFFFPAFFPGLF